MQKNNEMPFWDHVYEIRRRIFIVLSFILGFTIIAYLFFPYYFNAIQNVVEEDLYATNITEGFLTRLKISVLLGAFLTIPLLLFEIVLFAFPALKKKEKLFFLLTMIGAFILFIFGVIFAYKSVLPISINFLKQKAFFPDNVSRLISYQTFITFFFQFLLGFGICFQFPIVIILLLKFKLVKMTFLVKNFKYVIIICFLLSAIITPPDIVSQILLAVPMLFLYTLCIIIGKIFQLGL